MTNSGWHDLVDDKELRGSGYEQMPRKEFALEIRVDGRRVPVSLVSLHLIDGPVAGALYFEGHDSVGMLVRVRYFDDVWSMRWDEPDDLRVELPKIEKSYAKLKPSNGGSRRPQKTTTRLYRILPLVFIFVLWLELALAIEFKWTARQGIQFFGVMGFSLILLSFVNWIMIHDFKLRGWLTIREGRWVAGWGLMVFFITIIGLASRG